jgi:5-(carboxyamino)imidazole ribonucleotide mutase
MGKVVILMGSKGDLQHCEKIHCALESLGVKAEMRVASAHKVPLKAYDIIKKAESPDTVFITVAGRSNALSGFSDAQTYCPVIACPPYSERYAGADIYSSLRMPSGVAVLTVLEPELAALAAAKILGMKNGKIRENVAKQQDKKRREIEEDDEELVKAVKNSGKKEVKNAR